MKFLLAVLAVAPVCLWAADGRAVDLARQLREASLDAEECYQVRDLHFTKEDLRFFLTDGYLIFSKPVDGARNAAVFVAEGEGDDAEMLLFAPTRGERLSLANNTGSPTLNEHFRAAVMIFTDDTYEVLRRGITARGEPRRDATRGLLISQQWSSVVRNLTSSFEIRLVRDMINGRDQATGVFYAALNGVRLGNFDVVYDPLGREQIVLGKVAFRDDRTFFDVWTSFQARAFRNGSRKPRRPDLAVRNYRIDATLQPDLSLKVITRMSVKATAPLDVLDFDLSRRMRVSEASIDGVPGEVFQRESMRSNLIRGRGGDDVFLLIPPARLETGRQYELEFHHEGAVVADTGNRVYYVGSRSNWYPSVAAQFADFDVTFHYPEDLDLVAAGEVVEHRTADGLSSTRRRTSSPIRFFGFNLGDYERVGVKRGKYTIEVCANRQLEPALAPPPKQVVLMPPSGWPRDRRRPEQVVTVEVDQPPPNPTARLGGLAREIGDAFEFMAGHFGAPTLPHLTVSPIPGAFGQGFPGLVYLSTLSYLGPQERPKAARSEFSQVFFSEILHAHETAHQWWGNLVISGSYQDDWLMEALANYSALLYLEKRKGRAALESVLDEYRKRLLAAGPDGKTLESAGPIVWGVRLDSSQSPGAWRTIIYEKGSWILHMLRHRIGDDPFLRMLGELRERFQYQSVTTEDFRHLAAGFLPPGSVDSSLESFFDNWVYSTGIPTLRLRSSVRGNPPKVQLSATLSQSGAGEDFSVHVPVVVQVRGGKPIVRWLETGDQPVSFEMTLRQRPVKVELDPGNSILATRE